MNFSAKSRFTTIMVVTASISMLLVGAIAWVEGQKSLEKAEFTHLTSIRVAKARQIENYFKTINNQLIVLSEDRTMISAMVKLSRGFRLLEEATIPKLYDDALKTFYQNQFIPKLEKNLAEGSPRYSAFEPKAQSAQYLQYHYVVNNKARTDDAEEHSFLKADDSSNYSKFHDRYHPGLHEFKERFGFYDIFLIDFNSGDIVYTVAKEVDYGTNLLTGPYRATGLADVVRKVRKNPMRHKTHIVDFAPYLPSYNAPASFIAAPVYNGQHIVGIIALQIPADKIQDIMSSQRNWRNEGMGESGETYIIGADLLMRSDSRFLLEDKEAYFDHIRGMGLKEDIITLIDKLNTTVLLQPVQTKSARSALRGEEGQFIAEDYRGISVLTSYSKLDINGLNWGVISEISEEEAFKPIERLLRHILLSTAIFIPIVAYLSYMLSQGFMRPVQTLVATAKTIRGQYDAGKHDDADIIKFETEGASEYQELSAEMNHIMRTVRGDSIDIQQKQREYTDLITKTLPISVAERFRNGEELISDSTEQATAIFIQLENSRSVFNLNDMRNTTRLMETLTTQIHQSAEHYGIDLFKQIGMEFLGICGLTVPYSNHFERSMKFAQSIINITAEFNATYETNLIVNMGAEVGPMFGTLQTGRVIEYDILSDTTYTAQEVGYAGALGRLTVSDTTKKYCEGIGLVFVWEKDEATVKVKGNDCSIWNISKDDLVQQVIENSNRV